MKFVVVVVGFALVSACVAYVFDASSCVNMLPTTDLTDTTASTRTGSKSKGPNNNQVQTLTQSTEPAPYRITVDTSKYRRNRTHTVKIEATNSSEFNGFMLQARQFHQPQTWPAVFGTFINLPSGIRTLDCDRGPSISVSNTAVSDGDDVNSKKRVELKWKAPTDDVGSILFVSTVIRGSTYWQYVFSPPLIINDFPPVLDGCGKDSSCFRYSQVQESCNAGHCNYLVVSKVVSDYVVITIGGKIDGDYGYVGIGFTPDKDKLSFVDVCACMKKGAHKVDAAHYMITQEHGPLEKHHEELEDEETDVDGAQIWCRFRRPLYIPGSQAADLTKNLFQLFLWGNLDADGTPVMPKNEDIVRAVETWNHTQTLNVVHLVGGSDIARISWTILIAVLLATLIELY